MSHEQNTISGSSFCQVHNLVLEKRILKDLSMGVSVSADSKGVTRRFFGGNCGHLGSAETKGVRLFGVWSEARISTPVRIAKPGYDVK